MATKTKKKEDEKSPLPPYVCVMDAQEQNEKNRRLYSDAQLDLSVELLCKASACYDAQVYRNFRENFIAVKIAAPTKANRASSAVAALDKWCAANNIEIKTRGKSVLYHIRRV